MTVFPLRPYLRLALAGLLPFLGACADTAPPILSADVATSWGVAPQTGALPSGERDWWRRIGDDTLDRLIEQALVESPDLHEARARVVQAEAQMRLSGASIWPQVGVGVQMDGQRLSPDADDGLEDLGLDVDPDIGRAQLKAQASWEIDIWGKAAGATRADAYGYLSADQAYRAAITSLVGQIATAYADLRTLDERLGAARQVKADRQALLQIAQTRHAVGVAPADDPIAATAQLRQQDATVATLAMQRAQTRHALALLVGRTDEQAAPLLADSGVVPIAPAAPAAGLPNDLLRSRPDVMQAEYAALAQFARLTSAKAGLYPSLSLSGALGSSTSSITNGSVSDLFNWRRRVLSAGLAVSMPLFNHGKLVAQVDIQDAGFVQAVAAYEQAVLAAQRDVLDALAQDAYARQAADHLAAGLAASRRQTALATKRHQAGTGVRADRLNAQIAENAAADADIQARGETLKAWIALNRALGPDTQGDRPSFAAPSPAASPEISRP